MRRVSLAVLASVSTLVAAPALAQAPQVEKNISMTMVMATTTISGIAQESTAPPSPPARPDAPGHDNIIIRKKSDKGEKMTIVVDGDKVTINGKPIAEYKGDDVIINQKHLDEMVGREMERAQFEKHMAEMNHQLADLDRQIELEVEPRVRNRIRYHSRAPRILLSEDAPMALTFDGDGDFSGEKHAFLGVTTEKTDKGVRITNITDESAAEKAGLAEGDVITTLDGKSVKDQEALTKMVAILTPEQKTEFEKMKGKEFDMSGINPFGGGRGGPPGGPGGGQRACAANARAALHAGEARLQQRHLL